MELDKIKFKNMVTTEICENPESNLFQEKSYEASNNERKRL